MMGLTIRFIVVRAKATSLQMFRVFTLGATKIKEKILEGVPSFYIQKHGLQVRIVALC